MVNGRITPKAALRAIGRPGILAGRVEAQRQQIIEQAQREQALREREEAERPFDIKISELSKQLSDVKSQIISLSKVGRSSAGLNQKELELNVTLAELSRLKAKAVPFEQAFQSAGFKAQAAGLGTAFAAAGQRLSKELKKEGIDLSKLRSGEVTIEELSPVQLQSLQRRGLVEAVSVSGEPQRDVLEGIQPIFDDQGNLVGINTGTQTIPITADISPIIVGNLLAGFESESQRQSFAFKSPVEVSEMPFEIPRGVVQLPEGDLERFQKLITERIPEFENIESSKLKNLLKKSFLVPAIIGASTQTIQEKLGVSLGKLKDDSGKFIFTPTQSRKLGELTTEIGVNVAGGQIFGKAITLGKGAIASKFATSLTQSPKFKKVFQVVDLTILGTLSAAEINQINKIHKTQGEDAALLRLIGDVSFVAGFAKTGLKSTPQATKEFNELANAIKKTVPKSKKGQAALIRRRKKKRGELLAEEVGAISAEETENILKAKSKLEKKLLKSKNLEEQYKVLAEIRKRLKTDLQKENFNKLVLELIEKDILKIKPIEVAPGVFVKAPPKFKASVERPLLEKPFGEQVLESRFAPAAVGKKSLFNLNKEIKKTNTFEIRRNRIELSTLKRNIGSTKTKLRIKLAEEKRVLSRLMNQKGSKKISQLELQGLISKQREKVKQIEQQRLSFNQIAPQLLRSKQKQNQAFRQLARQTSIQRNRLESRTRLRLLVRTTPVLRTIQRSRRIIRRKGLTRLRKFGKFIKLPPLKIPELEGKPKKKKLKKKIILPGRNVNVFVRRRGVFKKINRKPLTKKTAVKKLKKRLQTSLSASGFLKNQAGRKLRIKATGDFRLGKRDKFLLVEKRSKRLNTRSETSSIQQAKKFKIKTKKSKMKATKLINFKKKK